MTDPSQQLVFLWGTGSDLELLATYLLTAVPGPPHLSGIVQLLRTQLVDADTRGNGVARIALPPSHAEGLKAWLDKDACRLAEEGHHTMSAVLRRISFEV